MGNGMKLKRKQLKKIRREKEKGKELEKAEKQIDRD